MPREIELSVNEQSFLLNGLNHKLRLDARTLESFRNVEFEFGKAGTAQISLGKTRVLAQVSADVVQPQPDRKFDGTFTIAVELSAMPAPAFETGRQNELESMLAHLLERAIRRSNAVDTESLCILAGQKCWSVRADVHVLDFDGGLVDASCIAVLTALRHFRLPDVKVDGDEVTVYAPADRTPIPLSLLHWPICVTISFFHGGETVVVDATWREQQVSEGEMVVTANAQGEICQIAKLGGVSTDAVLLLRCLELAIQKGQEIGDAISKALELDEKKRNPKSMLAELQAENKR